MSPDPPALEIRDLETRDELLACCALQRRTWGEDFAEVVPPAILMIVRKVGGVAAGAFDRRGELLGFVFGITGIREGRLAHWSHMLAVVPEAKGRGLGKRLKLYQRQRLLEHGVEVVYWTYDPLVAVNANLNLNALGARPIEYRPDMYGGDTGSELHSGLGTDRFVVQWELESQRVVSALEGRGGGAQEGGIALDVVHPREPTPPAGASAFLVEIPADIQEVKEKDRHAARRWREVTRRTFVSAFESGYGVEGFVRDDESGRCFYLVKRGGASPCASTP